MTDAEFLQLEKEMLTELQQMKEVRIDNDFYTKLSSLRFHIVRNPQNQYVQDFITNLINIHLKHLITQDLINALNIHDYFYYGKQYSIYKSLQHYYMRPFVHYLPNILEIPSDIYWNPFKTLFYVLQQYAPNLKNDPNLQAIEDFVNNNPNILFGSKDDYYDLEKEKELYNLARQGRDLDELKEYTRNHQQYPEDARRSFINKRIGNIGEIYVYNNISKNYWHYFVAKDIKNGFGYDIYYLDNNNIENLIEVKTTTLDKEDDTFYMSENEYNVMKKCTTSNYANYWICRVKLDKELKPTYSFLIMRDEQTLIDVNNTQIEYKLSINPDNSVTCKRNTLSLIRTQ